LAAYKAGLALISAKKEKAVPPSMDLRTALKNGIAQLREANVASYTLAAELLLLHVLGRDRTWLYAHPEEVLIQADVQRFFSLIAHRASGEPTQHLTGKQEFWGLEFEVTPDVLIPRPETEHLIEVVLDILALQQVRKGKPQTTAGEGLQIADIGTGSGCIAVALAKELSAATVFATDISAAALSVARQNAVRHGVAERIHFIESNLFDFISRSGSATQFPDGSPPSFGLIISNPPYIGRREAASLAREVRDHEPEIALYGGEEGYEFYGNLIAQAALRLKPGGLLILELGHNSLPAVQPLLEPASWTGVGVSNDLAGTPRVIAAERV
jgi:release factor glutamine methyltransferase